VDLVHEGKKKWREGGVVARCMSLPSASASCSSWCRIVPQELSADRLASGLGGWRENSWSPEKSHGHYVIPAHPSGGASVGSSIKVMSRHQIRGFNLFHGASRICWSLARGAGAFQVRASSLGLAKQDSDSLSPGNLQHGKKPLMTYSRRPTR
jgi:hypothetical protein